MPAYLSGPGDPMVVAEGGGDQLVGWQDCPGGQGGLQRVGAQGFPQDGQLLLVECAGGGWVTPRSSCNRCTAPHRRAAWAGSAVTAATPARHSAAVKRFPRSWASRSPCRNSGAAPSSSW